MIVVNFSHPLTDEQLARLESLSGEPVERTLEVSTQFDHAAEFIPQVVALANAVGLTSAEWQTLPLLIVPPALNFIAVTLLAELHGRIGHFPSCVRLRPVEGAVPPRYEIAEILPLNAVRDRARRRR